MFRIYYLVIMFSSLSLWSCGTEEVGFFGSSDARPTASIQLLQGAIGERYLQQPETQQELFTQEFVEAKLDLLMVVDNSGSMQTIQANLAQRLAPLLRYVEESDWQIAVATTDASDPCIVGILRRGENDLDDRFRQLASQGINGSANETGIYNSVRALQMGTGCNSEPWVRPDSIVAVLIVSDEDNCSNGLRFNSDCFGQAYQRSDYLVDYLASIRTIGETARVYGLIWIPGQSCSTAQQSGNVYMDAIQRTQGRAGSICDTDYTQTLETISKDISVILSSQYKLAYTPDPASILVVVNDRILTAAEYELKGRSIRIKETPAQDSVITIKYDPIDIDEIRFAIREDYSGEVFAMVNGRQLHADEYTVNHQEHFIEFNEPIPYGAVVLIFYGEESILRREFQIRPGLDIATMKVMVDGKEVNDFEYDTTTGKLAFKQMPAEGAEIRINYVAQR